MTFAPLVRFSRPTGRRCWCCCSLPFLLFTRIVPAKDALLHHHHRHRHSRRRSFRCVSLPSHSGTRRLTFGPRRSSKRSHESRRRCHQRNRWQRGQRRLVCHRRRRGKRIGCRQSRFVGSRRRCERQQRIRPGRRRLAHVGVQLGPQRWFYPDWIRPLVGPRHLDQRSRQPDRLLVSCVSFTGFPQITDDLASLLLSFAASSLPTAQGMSTPTPRSRLWPRVPSASALQVVRHAEGAAAAAAQAEQEDPLPEAPEVRSRPRPVRPARPSQLSCPASLDRSPPSPEWPSARSPSSKPLENDPARSPARTRLPRCPPHAANKFVEVPLYLATQFQ